jgi:hypothetical protein
MTANFLENIVAESLQEFFPNQFGIRVANSVNAQNIERPFVLVEAAPDDLSSQFGFYGVVWKSVLNISAISGNSSAQNWRENHRSTTDRITQILFNDRAIFGGPPSLREAIDSRQTQSTILQVLPIRVSSESRPNSQVDTITVELWYRTDGVQMIYGDEIARTTETAASIAHTIEDVITERLEALLPQTVLQKYEVTPGHSDEALAPARIVTTLASAEVKNIVGTFGGFNIRYKTTLFDPALSVAVTSAFVELEQHNEACEEVRKALLASTSSSIALSGRFIYDPRARLNYIVVGSVGDRQMGEFSVTDSFPINFYGVISPSG